jgi:uncharacterized protein (DUF1697 family)
MARYAAFLRGVSPTNAKMPELVHAFASAGFGDVKTILSSGNVNFTSRPSTQEKLQDKAEAAMQKHLGKAFLSIVRELSELAEILASDPYARFKVPAKSKRVITFLRSAPATPPKLPVRLENACIYCVEGGAAFSAYVPGDEGPVFMKLIERTFGKDVSTRTWDTVAKIVKAG